MGAFVSAAVHAAVRWLGFWEGYGSHSFAQPACHAAHGNYPHHDPDNVHTLRRFGFRVCYGDCMWPDPLEPAGAHHAAVIVDTIDDVASSLKLIGRAHEDFPNLRVSARARNVPDWQELRACGASIRKRETFESALLAGRHVLEALGVHSYEARQRGNRFRRRNLATLDALRAEIGDETRRVAFARAARDALAHHFERDAIDLERQLGSDWRRVEER